MTFSEKLKQAMQELHLNQRQVCGMTGKSKGSVSQYLSGKQIPSDDVQSAIAVALGLESDYFSKSDEQVVVLPTAELRNGVIPRLDVEKAAKLLQMNHNTVRKGLQQGVFPWGYGIHTSDNRNIRGHLIIAKHSRVETSGYFYKLYSSFNHATRQKRKIDGADNPTGNTVLLTNNKERSTVFTGQ